MSREHLDVTSLGLISSSISSSSSSSRSSSSSNRSSSSSSSGSISSGSSSTTTTSITSSSSSGSSSDRTTTTTTTNGWNCLKIVVLFLVPGPHVSYIACLEANEKLPQWWCERSIYIYVYSIAIYSYIYIMYTPKVFLLPVSSVLANSWVLGHG